MFRKSLTLSLLVNFSVGAALVGGAAKADVQPKGTIEFTADNASQVFLNGKSLGLSGEWYQEPVNLEVDSELQQGRNVIGVAAWDYESIAAMSGKFVMPDGTTFDTSINHYKEWFAWDAAPGIKDACTTESCVGKDRAEGSWRDNEINPLTLSDDDIDIPEGWNLPGIDVDGWQVPGWSTGSPWTAYNPGQGWIWLETRLTGEGADTSNANPWVTNNFTLFRYEFYCMADYCDTEDGWANKQIINVDSRKWDDIKQIDVDTNGKFVDAKTYPIFAGGVLSFSGSGNQSNYTQNFFLANREFLEENGLSELWDKEEGENRIDVFGNYVAFKGELIGPGGMIYQSSKSKKGVAELANDNSYTGPTIVRTGTLRVTGSLSDYTPVTVESQGRYEVKASDVIRSIEGSGSVDIDSGQVLSAGWLNDSTLFSGRMSGEGGFTKQGDGITEFSGINTFSGPAVVEAGTLKVTGQLGDRTPVNVQANGRYWVAASDTIGSIEGLGLIDIERGVLLTAGALKDSTFAGMMAGQGGFTKIGLPTTTVLSGRNSYSGPTVIREGVLKAGARNALSEASPTTVMSEGHLNLGGELQIVRSVEVLRAGSSEGRITNGQLSVSRLTNQGMIEIKNLWGTPGDDVFVNAGSIVLASEENAFDLGPGDDTLITNARVLGPGVIDGGAGAADTIVFEATALSEFKAGKIRNFESARQKFGSWDYDGNYKKAGIGVFHLDGGAMRLDDNDPGVFRDVVMNGGAIVVGISDKDTAPLVADTFAYNAGELRIDAGQQDQPEGDYLIIDAVTDPAEMEALAKKTLLIYDGKFAKEAEFFGLGKENGVAKEQSPLYDVYTRHGSYHVVVEKTADPEIPDRPDIVPGCEDDPLCKELITGGGSPPDIFEEIVVPPFLEGDLDLPIISWNTVAKLVFSGLSPRNVDGPGRGLATYSNLLSDTVFERLPLRQFAPVEVDEAVVEQEQVIEVVPEQEPVRGLWSKSGEVSDAAAQQALDQAIAQSDAADLDQSLVLASETVAFELNGVSYVENPSLTAQYAERDGVRGWFRAFGGNSGASRSDVFYNDYSVSTGGGVVGVDVSVAPQVQIGAFANYGTINLNQYSGYTGGGSWNPDGWGGGITADYWTDNFYVQGLVAATGFNGSQRRGIIEITDQLGGESASGDKSATNYTYAVRLGAPFETGRWMLEPQFTATWAHNQEHAFSESGAGQLNLRYQDRSTLYLQTELGIKFTLPINSGDRGLWVPSLKLAWLGDWNQNNGDQTIGYAFTNKTVGVPSNQEDVNGALVEVGLDYTIANLNSTSWKLYVKGGAELWGGDRGTDWRGSGGVTWQF